MGCEGEYPLYCFRRRSRGPAGPFRHLDLDTVKTRFSSPVRALGEALYAQGRVHLLRADADVVWADIQDGRDVRAWVSVSGGLHGSCACVSFSRRSELCPHMWAAVLAGHSQGGFLPPAWRRHLGALRQRLEAPPRPRRDTRILYVVNEVTSRSLGRLHVHVVRAQVRKDGSLGRTDGLTTTTESVARLPDPADRRIHTLLQGAMEGEGYLEKLPRHRYTVSGPLAGDVVPLLCATGRFVHGEALAPLTFEPAEPWRLDVDVERRENGDVQVVGRLRRGQTSRALGEPALVLDGVVIDGGRVALLDTGGLLPWLRAIGPAGLHVPSDETETLLRELVRTGRERVRLPGDLRLEEVRAEARPRLRVTAWEPRRLAAHLSFDYDGASVPASEPGEAVLAPGLKVVVRDLESEARAQAQALAAGLHVPRTLLPNLPDFQVAPGKLAGAVRRLVAEGWVVEADGKLYRTAGKIRFRVSSGIDWFDLQATVDFGGQKAALPAVLAALRRKEGTVRLGDGTFGVLPEEWLKRYRSLLGMGRPEAEALRFERSQASLLDALLAEQGEADVDAAFERARAGLARVDAVRPADPPTRFAGTLRSYQRDGLGWLRFLEQAGLGGCLADDMGLGKTVQVLAHLASRPPGPPSLIVVPRSLVFNWKEEAARFVPGLRVLDHSGPSRPRAAAAFDGQEVVLTTYGVLRRDVSWMKEAPFDYAVLDEAQAIKNADSDSAKAARLVRAQHRLALSGTPVENRLDDLWSLFEFLNPGMLGRSSAFVAAGAGRAEIDEDGRRILARALRPFILRRTKRQVARDLPERVEQTLHCELDEAQRTTYDEVRTHYQRALLARTARDGVRRSMFLVLEALLRLRQAACHPGLIDPQRGDEPCAKLDTLLPLLEDVLSQGSKALVFSQFTSFLAILRRRLEGAGIVYEYLDGQTSDRERRVRRFQDDPDCPVFLVSLKAGGLGLNLTAADYVFLLDPWWNPAAEAQAIDRAHRIGQSKTVFAYRIVARDTIEEKVLSLQEGKRALAEAVVRADESILGELDHAELERLLS